jgi:hypothetical protein
MDSGFGVIAHPEIVTTKLDELKHAGLRAVAASVAGFDQSGVATVSIFVARANVVKQVLHQVFTGELALGGLDSGLFKLGLACKNLCAHQIAAAVTNQHLSGSSSRFNSIFHFGQGDELFDHALNFLRAAKRGSNVSVSNELPAHVSEQVHPLIARES